MWLNGAGLNANAHKRVDNRLAGSLSGMTGFGRGLSQSDDAEIRVEARSVNGKGLDIRLRLPSGFEAFENDIRNAVKARFNRGSVSINIHLSEGQSGSSIQIDQVVLDGYTQATQALVDQGVADRPSADGLLALKGVLISDEELDEARLDSLKTQIMAGLDQALESLKSARLEEGLAMERILNQQLEEIEGLYKTAVSLASAQPDAIRDRLKVRLDELLPKGFDKDRLAQEAAALALKADVREELDRLQAHIQSAHKLINQGSPCGRKLDFLAQEFNRESNTLCSKSADSQMTDTGLALKAVIDQMREQVQNVE